MLKGYLEAKKRKKTLKKNPHLKEWIKEFDAARKRPLALHLDNSFIHTYKPVMDDAPYRSFNSMKEYRKWCEKKLPKWLGYGKGL